MTQETKTPAKTFMLMRHGEADVLSGQTRHSQLTPRGKTQAETVAKELVVKNLVPDIILYSPVLRAAQTAKAVRDIFARAGKKVEMEEAGWLGINNIWMRRRTFDRAMDDSCNNVLAVTHEQQFEMLANIFNMEAEPGNAEIHVLKENVSTWKSFRNPSREHVIVPRFV